MRSKSEFYKWFRTEHNRLHERWSAEVGTPGYDKPMWIKRQNDFHALARSHATPLGIEPPYLQETWTWTADNITEEILTNLYHEGFQLYASALQALGHKVPPGRPYEPLQDPERQRRYREHCAEILNDREGKR